MKQRRPDQVAAVFYRGYEAGGSGSPVPVDEDTAGFWRNIITPTTIGMAINNNDRQRNT
jgi:hypothetical protein